MIDFFSALMAKLADSPWLQGVVAALATFVLEDPTTIGAGLLVADGKMALWTAFVGVSAGIALGDLGLYAGGRLLGPKVVGRGPLTPERIRRAERWFRRNVIQAVVFSRFVPGMRLPTYVGAGFLKAPFWRFAATAILASLAWTALLLTATIALGRQILPFLGQWRWPVAFFALVLLVLLQRRAGVGITSAEEPETHDVDPVISSFEFWQPWFFYMPVALKWIQLSIRRRGLLLPTAANPSIYGGGFIGESKSEILNLVPVENRSWVAGWVKVGQGQGIDATVAAMRDAGLDFPVVAKPDVGQRGAGVQPIESFGDLRAYNDAFPRSASFVVQEFAGGVEPGRTEDHPSGLGDAREAGVMWWRRPGRENGTISSITIKITPKIVGDGRRTVEELIDRDPRARRIAAIYKKRHREQLGVVLDLGEIFPLVFAGNHCQGAIFRDGTSLLTPQLNRRIESIAQSIPEFWFGRFDIRFEDLGQFLNGENFKIIEINGASAEATHIWDASITLREAYRVLFEQFEVLFEIGEANRNRGFEPTSLRRFLRDLSAYRKIVHSYPLAR